MNRLYPVLFFLMVYVCYGEKPPKEVSVSLRVKMSDSIVVDSLDAFKTLQKNFQMSHIPLHENSPLILEVDLYEANQMYVSKLASELRRMEIKAHIRLFDRNKKEPYYSFDAICKSVEEGLQKAQMEAIKSLLMDERELDLLSKKIKEIWGKEFY